MLENERFFSDFLGGIGMEHWAGLISFCAFNKNSFFFPLFFLWAK